MGLGCTICTGTCGSGVRTGQDLIRQARPLIRKGLPRESGAGCGAVRGSTLVTSVALPFATILIRASVSALSVSELWLCRGLSSALFFCSFALYPSRARSARLEFGHFAGRKRCDLHSIGLEPRRGRMFVGVERRTAATPVGSNVCRGRTTNGGDPGGVECL